MQTLLEQVNEAKKKGVALGHFNISNIEMMWAVVRAAEKMNLPVVIGVSEGEREFMGEAMVRGMISTRLLCNSQPIYLNADHTYSFERAKQVIDLQYDSIVIDGAKLKWEENVALTKKVVDYAKSVNSPIIVEGELGYIGQSSQLLDKIPDGASVTDDTMTTVAQAEQFIKETGIQMFSPAVGSMHGMLKAGNDPDLNIARIKEISSTVNVPLVLHGGSGLTNENFTNAIKAGISLIHVSTELRVAWRRSLTVSLQEDHEEVAPYKILKPVVLAVQKVVEDKLKLFNNL